jgi:demethylmenaquinone methyltransferase/2-methoxy-6-polyprenyl-1,4-benzoquinol methylase
MDEIDRLLHRQSEYYRARAPEYEDWFYRRRRYDRGPHFHGEWNAEVAFLRGELERFRPEGDVLELACGTGLWTRELLPTARRVTAVDAAPEMLALNRERVQSARVEYIRADLFAWRPERRYDSVFFGFWLSHVPADRFERFWKQIADSLKTGGRFFFVDSKYYPASTARDHTLGNPDEETVRHKLNDGREFRIVKVFHRPRELQDRLQALGWKAVISETPNFFIYGKGRRDP